MMIRSLIRRAPRVFACAAMLFVAAGPARSAQVSLPVIPVQIIGAESLCASWTLGGSAGAPTLTCVTGGGPAAFGCSLSGAPTAAIASGAAVNLTMSCSGGTAPYTYAWTPGGSTAGSLSANPTASTTYSVTARDSAGGTSTQSAAVTVSNGGGGGGGGGGGDPTSCSGFNNTVFLDLDVNNPSLSARSALSQTDAVVVRVKTGASGVYAKVSAAEYGGSQATRFATLSSTPCDFSTTSGTSIGTTVEVIFANGQDIYGFYPSMPPNSTAYFNLRTTGACGSNCGMLFQMQRY